MTFKIEIEQYGRWVVQVTRLPGVTAYGNTAGEAKVKAQMLTRHPLADRLENGDS